MLNKDNRRIFIKRQRYTFKINDPVNDGSVTCMRVAAEVGVVKATFFHALRRWLKNIGMPVQLYCIEAGLFEVLDCVPYPYLLESDA